MTEYLKCPHCGEYINLEIHIYRDSENNIYCCKCNEMINRI